MKYLHYILTIFFVTNSAQLFAAKLKVVTTTTDLAWVTREIGGEIVEVESLLSGSEDPHYAEAVPKYIRSVANADIVCAVGLGLEIGWLPKVLAKSGNAKVQPGGAGFCELGSQIKVLDKASGPVDRSMGDVHPEGNPHFWLGVSSMIEGARVVKDVLASHSPKHKQTFEESYSTWKQKFEKVLDENRKKIRVARADRPLKVMPYHSEFAYFFKDYQIQYTEAMEEKPGVAPSAGRLAKASALAKNQGVNLVLASETHPRDVLRKFEELSGIPVVIVPVTVKLGTNYADGFSLQTTIVDKILAQVK